MSALEVWLMVEKVVVGEMGDWVETDGRCTDDQDMVESVGDMVRLFGGRTLSAERGCRIAGGWLEHVIGHI